MRIDFATLAFGYTFKVKGGSPNWATSLGQGKGYKINDRREIDELIKGLLYSSIALAKVTSKIGKGGATVLGNANNTPIILASLFKNVYINDTRIDDGKYIILVTKDDSNSHKGRLRLKYGPSNTYKDNNISYSNENFWNQVKKQLGMGENACFFVYDISVQNQDKLILKTIFINDANIVEYEDSNDLHKEWDALIDKDENKREDKYLVEYETGYKNSLACNRILFGAPGTGKSYRLKKDCENYIEKYNGDFERVTFHPDYTYSKFVGTYKPISDDDGKIRYDFVPGPFMRILVKSLENAKCGDPKPYLLLIEEVNRAKVAAVFGDVFQLLDRDENGVSEYEIETSEDIRNYLASELGGEPIYYKKIKIPNNMFIWATMNSADQGVFPMDTAFKRRWSFEYLGINENESHMHANIKLGKDKSQEIDWNTLRRAINEKLSSEYKVNEDKLMGPFFLSKKVLKTVSETDDTIEDTEGFIEAFKSKVIMYLYEDAAKQHKHKLFSGCEDTTKYSYICEKFDEIGIKIFGDDFEAIYYSSQNTPQKG